MTTSFEQLGAAARAVGLGPADQLTITAGFLAGANAGAVDTVVRLATELTAAAGVTPDLMAEVLAGVVDRRGQTQAFGTYLTAVVSACAAQRRPAEPAAASPAATIVLSDDDRAAVTALLGLTAPPAGVPVGEALFSRSAVVGDPAAPLEVVFEVMCVDSGCVIDLYARRGRTLAGTHPPVKALQPEYRFQVDARPFVLTLS